MDSKFKLKSKVFKGIEHIVIIDLNCYEKEKYKKDDDYFKAIDRALKKLNKNKVNQGYLNKSESRITKSKTKVLSGCEVNNQSSSK